MLASHGFDLRTATVHRLNPGVSGEHPQKSQAHQPVRLMSQANFGCPVILAQPWLESAYVSPGQISQPKVTEQAVVLDPLNRLHRR